MSELKKVNIFPGRFQPFHNGHLKACEDAFKKNGLPVYIMYIHNEKFDSRKPFDDELTKKELERLVDKYEYIEGINWIRRPMPMTICRVCIENGYEPVLWLAGEDRIDGYKKLMKGKSIKDELGIDEPEFYITKRYGSATDVREAIKNDDEEKFKELMPKEAHDLFSEFKKQISSIKESNILKYIQNNNMKSIINYINENINENLLILENENGEFITEGEFWKKVGDIFKTNSDKALVTAKKLGKGAVNALGKAVYAGAKYVDDKHKQKIAAELDSIAKGKEEGYKEVYNTVDVLSRDIDKEDSPFWCISQLNLLKEISNELNKEEGKKLAAEFEEIINKKWPRGGKEYQEKVEKPVDNSGVTNQQSPKEQPTEGQPTDDKSSIGLGKDGEQLNTSKEQETNAVTNEIKDNQDFFKQIANEAGINGETLRDSIVGLINSSLKTATKDKNGNTIYKWQKDTKGFQTKNEDKLIKGLGAIICGLSMINHKGMNEKITDVLIDIGFSKQDYLNNLIKK